MTEALALLAVVIIMVIELRLSQRNERRLRREGAIEAAGDVYGWMRIIYPACFVAMAAEGLARSAPPRWLSVAGLFVFIAAKALKTWAIAALGGNWSFHVLVKPHQQLTRSGPYRYLRHPNYLAVVGEVAAMAMLVAAPVTGAFSLVLMALLLLKRIAVEERALGLRA